MSREGAITRVERYFGDGGLLNDLSRRVAIPTASQEPSRLPELRRYLVDEMVPCLDAMGFTCQIIENSVPGNGPFLVARRMEADDLLTVMSYGHGDVISGQEGQWKDGLDPWQVTVVDDRWYGRGTADNKVQHTINMAAMAAVLEERGKLGFNVVMLIETGEETGSLGLRELCTENRDLFDADLFLASDGPRARPDQPTIFLGSRGTFNFKMNVDLRDGGHHSGNWGGLLANPGVILAHAIAAIISDTGTLQIPAWRLDHIPDSVRGALASITVDGGEDGPEIDPHWGEPGMSAIEKIVACNSFEVLAFKTGNSDNPVNAIPPKAVADCHVRYVVPFQMDDMMSALRAHLDERGFGMVTLALEQDGMQATRLDPDHPWVHWAVESMEKTTGQEIAVMPNLGGSLPNDVFADLLGIPTVWVPHSYASCSQHAPNEHVLAPVCHDALRIMAGLWWDLGDVDRDFVLSAH